MSAEVIHSRAALPPETDLLIVLGKNLGAGGWDREKVQSSPDLLSVDSCLNILAAGELYRFWRDIMLSGGRTIGPGFPSQPEAARDYLHKKYPYIPLSDVELEETGFDTAASAETIAEMIRKGTLTARHIGLISVGYHVKNAAKLFTNWGVPVESAIAAEDIVAERSPYHATFVETWRTRERVQKEEGWKREKGRGLFLRVDRKGKILRHLTRGRVEEPAGELGHEPQ